ncbi:MAG TPA: hypothetical protein VF278_02590 [Pirellulales bacterium]
MQAANQKKTLLKLINKYYGDMAARASQSGKQWFQGTAFSRRAFD